MSWRVTAVNSTYLAYVLVVVRLQSDVPSPGTGLLSTRKPGIQTPVDERQRDWPRPSNGGEGGGAAHLYPWLITGLLRQWRNGGVSVEP